MTWKPVVAVMVLASAIVATTTPLFAQAVQTSSLAGTIKDSTGAVLPGVTVNVSSPSQVGGVQTSVTDSQGIYRFPALRPGVYEMETSLAGFKTVKQSDIVLALGTTTTIDVTLRGRVGQRNRAGHWGDLGGRHQELGVQHAVVRIPSCRTCRPAGSSPDIINLAPGVSSSVAFGGAQSSNALLMDGVDVSDPEGGTPWSFFNYNWVQEVQIVVARRQRRIRRVHRRRGQQHHPLRQQQVHGPRRVPVRAEELGRGQHDVAVGRPAEDVHAARDQHLLGHQRADRRSDREGQAVLLLRLPVFQPGRSAGRDSPATSPRKRSADDEQADVGGVAERPRGRVRRVGQVQHRGPRRQRDAADHRRHRPRAVAGVELERADHLDRSIRRRWSTSATADTGATSRLNRRRPRRAADRIRTRTA